MSPLTGLKMISFQFYKYIAPTALRKKHPPSPKQKSAKSMEDKLKEARLQALELPENGRIGPCRWGDYDRQLRPRDRRLVKPVILV